MALQLAYHKTHNIPTATYETASTRLFRHGRTEVIRTFSEDSWRWVKAMRDSSTDVSAPRLFSALGGTLTLASLVRNSLQPAQQGDQGAQHVHQGSVDGTRDRPPLPRLALAAPRGRIAPAARRPALCQESGMGPLDERTERWGPLPRYWLWRRLPERIRNQL